ncbi:DNA-methyltransferase [Amycolatopsis sp. NPDC059657]|uniref:DNA-methyltransferase n=1 Tax=Amycolatopsis sp. NPDC059657 TaxID=3346899 RepID=UPI003670DB6E
MTPGHTVFHRGDGVTLYTGDAAAVLAGFPGESVDCVVTSPPYWGLRDYRVRGQYGAESTVEEYVATLVAVFDELARVIKPGGSAWLNLGDTFGGSWGNYVAAGSESRTAPVRVALSYGVLRPPQSRHRSKDLIGVPWRVAFALQSAGWALRSAVVWEKPNARPESARDRLSQRYEMLFWLSFRDDLPPADPDSTGDVWTIPAERARTGHPAAGTLEVARRCLQHSCQPGAVVLDPFSGSGTTGIAARQLGHRFVGIDLDPACHALAMSRLLALIETPNR